MKKIGYIAVSLLVAGAAHADVYDIGTAGSITLLAGDTLTNTGGITDWGAGHATIADGSDLTSVDFASLGLTSWTIGTLAGSGVMKFDGLDMSGLQLNANAGNNNFFNDSFVNTDLSGATITATGNQPFLSSGGTIVLDGVDFSGTTFNMSGGLLGFVNYGSASMIGADFSGSIWNSASTATDSRSFNIGAGSTTAANKGDAADFSGANFSGLTSEMMGVLVTNLGESDTGFGNGAFYDGTEVLPAGYATADLAAAGWQVVPEPATLGLVAAVGGGMLFFRRRFMI